MKPRSALLNRWDQIRDSYWFLPSLMVVGAVLLSFVTLNLDVLLDGDDRGNASWMYTGSASGARAVLQTIATSMIGVAGVVFSITTVTLTLAANKFGPRIFRNFMRDTGNQVVLGTFTSTFLFCLLVLRQVRGSDNGFEAERFIPQVSLLTAFALAVCSVGVLIYFIHHVASLIQTSTVIAAVGRDLLNGVRDLYPEQIGDAPDREEADARLAAQIPQGFDREAVPIMATRGGYVRQIEADELVTRAATHDLLLRVERHPGDFVGVGDVFLRVWSPNHMTDEVINDLRSAMVVGDERTPTQDIRFPIGQLTEVACMAMSSGVNDFYTALMCVDRLGEGLVFLAGRSIPSPYRADESGRLRIVAATFDLPTLLPVAFDPIRYTGTPQPLVIAHLLDTLDRLADRTCRREDRAAVLAYADTVRNRIAEHA